MDETGQEETRPESVHSDNGSEEGGFVEVTQEDAERASQSWEQQQQQPQASVAAAEEDLDLYGDGDGAEGGDMEDEEKPLSPPPSPVDPTAEGQLIDFGGGSTHPAEGGEGGNLLVAGPPEPLFPSGEFNLDEMLGGPRTGETTAVGGGGDGTTTGDLLGGLSGSGGGLSGDPFGGAPSSSAADPFGLGQMEEPTIPEREPTPPPPEPEPEPQREPTPPPRDPTPPPPPPPKDPTPPPPPPKDPAPPPPPPKDPTPPPPPPKESRGVEEVTPPQPPHSTTPQKGRKPRPSGYLEFLKALHPVVLYIIYWRDLKLSAVVLGVCLVVLLTLTLNTVLHTAVLLLLSFMVVSLTYIVSKVIIDSFYNKKVKNPFHTYLEKDITLPEDVVMEWVSYAIRKVEVEINCLVRLLLFANIKHSLAFAVCLWVASFITNYLTLLSAMFLLVGVAFSVPWLYSQFQSQIDHHLDFALSKLGAVIKRVISYLPLGGKKKAE